jgi:hypothetical protein
MADYRSAGEYLGYDPRGNTYRLINGDVYRVNRFGQAMWISKPHPFNATGRARYSVKS